MCQLELKLIVACNMLDNLADSLRLGFVSIFLKEKPNKFDTFLIAISKLMFIHLVHFKLYQLKKLYMAQTHHLDLKR